MIASRCPWIYGLIVIGVPLGTVAQISSIA
jgi:hypothetical protein